MRSVAVAEWVLARFAGEQRAAAMLGDLLEQRQQRSERWFWRSLAGVLLAVAWRPVLGFVGAFYVANWALRGMMPRGFVGSAPHDFIWLPVLDATIFVGSFAWFVVVYAGIRYGVRDTLMQLAGALAVLATAVAFSWHYGPLLVAFAALTLAVVIASAAVRRRRGAAAAFLGTGLIYLASLYLTALLASFYQRRVLHLRIIGSVELQEHRSISYVVLFLMVMGQAVMAWACAKMHRSLIERGAVEPT
jgi:hypothetical protein